MAKVKIREAADILGVSMDTVRRRLKSGSLEGEKVFEGGVEIWLVSLPDRRTDTPPDPHQDQDRMVRVLLAQLEETRVDRDRWHAMAMALGARHRQDPVIALGSGSTPPPSQKRVSIWKRLRRFLPGG